jgi:hypothetical protein
VIEVELPLLDGTEGTGVFFGETTPTEKPAYLIVYELEVVNESDLEAPSVAQVGLDLLNRCLIGCVVVSEELALDLLDYLVHSLVVALGSSGTPALY